MVTRKDKEMDDLGNTRVDFEVSIKGVQFNRKYIVYQNFEACD